MSKSSKVLVVVGKVLVAGLVLVSLIKVVVDVITNGSNML